MTLIKRLFAESGSILKIGIPITIAQLLNISMSFVDTVMTGNYNAEALAAVSGSHHLIIPFEVFGVAVIGAAQAITAQFVGSGKAKQEIGKVTIHSILIGLIFSIFLILITRIAPLFLPFFGFEASVISLAADYLFAFSWGLPATMIFIGFAGFYAGISKPIMTMLISIIMLSVNVIGNYTLIFGHFGFPALGAEGAGWTSTLAAWSGTIGIIAISFFHKEIKQFNPFTLSFRPNKRLFKQILRIGIPSGFSSVFEVSMFAVFSLLMGRFGVEVLAGSQIALNCASILFMVPLGLSFAITTNIGMYIGQNKFREARFAGICGYVVNIIFNIGSAVMLIIFSREIAGVYTNDPQLISIASALLLFAGIFQLSDGAQVAGIGILRGYKDTKIPMISNLISYWGVGMSLGYFLGFYLGYQAKGMWIGIIIGLSVAAVLHGLRFKIVSDRKIRSAE
ncbi:MATE family efflux transporter [bacterium]|nr:MATE family efflux transporter [bacterium]